MHFDTAGADSAVTRLVLAIRFVQVSGGQGLNRQGSSKVDINYQGEKQPDGARLFFLAGPYIHTTFPISHLLARSAHTHTHAHTCTHSFLNANYQSWYLIYLLQGRLWISRSLPDPPIPATGFLFFLVLASQTSPLASWDIPAISESLSIAC